MKRQTIVYTLLFLAFTFACLAKEAKEEDQKQQEATTKVTQPTSDQKAVKLQPDGEANPPNIWMKTKLKNSQQIFVGMVEGDLLAVEEAARRMTFLNRLEYFGKRKSKNYRTQLQVFQFANDEILNGAKEKNLDRVTLGYNQMTLSCVACHKQLRKNESKP